MNKCHLIIGMLLSFLILGVPSFAQNLITDGGFENVSTYNVGYCYFDWTPLFGGCAYVTKPVTKPMNWNFTSQEYDITISNASSKVEGAYSLELWSVPSLKVEPYGFNLTTYCTLNLSVSGKCNQFPSVQQNGSTYSKVPFYLANSSATLSYNVKRCDEVPRSTSVGTCSEPTCHYGDPSLAPSGWHFIKFIGAKTYDIIPFTNAPKEWTRYSADLSTKNIDAGGYGLFIYSANINPADTNANCIMIDNISLEYKPPKPLVITEKYVSDMETMKPLYTETVGDVSYVNLSMSTKYDGTALVTVVVPTYTGSRAYCSLNYLLAEYNDGKVLQIERDVLRQRSLDVEYGICGAHTNLYFKFSVPNPENVKKLIFYDFYESGDFAWEYANHFRHYNVSWLPYSVLARKTYTNKLITTETITGYNDLAPIILYGNSILDNMTHAFDAWRIFDYYNMSATISFEQRDKNNNLKGIYKIVSPTNRFRNGITPFAADWIDSAEPTDNFYMNYSYSFDTATIQRYIVPNWTDTGYWFTDQNYTSRTDTRFGYAAVIAPLFCASGCEGIDWHDRVNFQDICIATIYKNDTRCYIAPPVPPQYQNISSGIRNFTSATGLLIADAYKSVDEGFDPTTKLILAFIITIGISGFVGYKAKSDAGLIAGSAFIGLLILFGFLMWIPAVIVILLVIIAGFILFKTVAPTFTGGG